MKKTISVLIISVLLLCMLTPFASAAKASDPLLLATLKPTRATDYTSPVINSTGSVRRVNGETYSYPNSIVTHPKSNEVPSIIDYDISGYSYTHFFAYIGKDAELAAIGRGVQFVVSADGNPIYKSDIIRIGDEPTLCVAEIPEGTKLLTLEVNSGGDGIDYDNSTWGTPTLSYMSIESVSELRHPNKITYKKGEELDLKGGYAKVTYGNGFVGRVALTNDMVNGYNKDVESIQTLTVGYGGLQYTFQVTVGNTSPTETNPAETKPIETKPVQTEAPEVSSDETVLTAEQTEGQGTEEKQPSVMLIVIIASAVVLLAVIALIIVIIKSKKGK